jgi:hypothetical protein
MGKTTAAVRTDPAWMEDLRQQDRAGRKWQEFASACKEASAYPFRQQDYDSRDWWPGWAEQIQRAAAALKQAGITAHVFSQPAAHELKSRPENWHAGRILFAAMMEGATPGHLQEMIAAAVDAGILPVTLGIAMERLPGIVARLDQQAEATGEGERQKLITELAQRLETTKDMLANLKPAAADRTTTKIPVNRGGRKRYAADSKIATIYNHVCQLRESLGGDEATVAALNRIEEKDWKRAIVELGRKLDTNFIRAAAKWKAEQPT